MIVIMTDTYIVPFIQKDPKVLCKLICKQLHAHIKHPVPVLRKR